MFHVIYRWVIACYFIGWLVASGIQLSFGSRWLIYLTNWGIVGFVFYLLVAALSVTTKFISVHVCNQKSQDGDRTSDYEFKKPEGCCGYGSNQLSWYQMFHWATFTIFSEIAFGIVALFWTVLYTGGSIDGVSANTHLVNGLVSIVDVFFFGVPVGLLHVIYPFFFCSAYASFSGIYWAANGTNPGNERYIYPVLDYETQPTSAAILVILACVVLVPLVHLVFYALHLARFWLVYTVYGRNKVSCWGKRTSEAEKNEMESQE